MSYPIWRSNRPIVAVECIGGKKLGNCFHATYYRVTSTSRLSREAIGCLRSAGVLGYGQGFYIQSPCDGKEEPAGHDMVGPVDEETGKSVEGAPMKFEYFIYKTEDQCDSGD